MLTPERSIEIQNAIGADIIMQLDDVVKTTTVGPRVEEAMHRLVVGITKGKYVWCWSVNSVCTCVMSPSSFSLFLPVETLEGGYESYYFSSIFVIEQKL